MLAKIKGAILAACVAVLMASAAALADQINQTDLKNQVKSPAPALDGGVGFLNSDAAPTLAKLKGRFVLLDFWTFCCINCMHILPKLDELEHQYGDRLTVVGIHSAKFENEKDQDHIRQAILRYGIKHAVINDADFKIWDAYKVQAWPTLILIDPQGNIIARFAGEGHTPAIAALIDKLSPGYEADHSLQIKKETATLEKSTSTMLSFPGKVILSDDQKSLIIADSAHSRIVEANLSADGHSARIKKIIDASPAGDRPGAFNHPQGLAVHGNALWVADTLSNTIKTVPNFNAADNKAEKSEIIFSDLNSPWDIVFAEDNLYVAMAGSHQIFKGDLNKKKITAFAGSGRENIKDGPAKVANLAQPSGITHDGDYLYVADAEDSGIRKIDLKDGSVSTLIGKGLFAFGDVDGPLSAAKLQHPLGIAAATNIIYIADSYNHKIKALDLQSATIKTIAGTGKSGYKDGPGAEAQFAEPGGLTVRKNTIYVADTNNNCIRYIDIKSGLTGTLKLIVDR